MVDMVDMVDEKDGKERVYRPVFPQGYWGYFMIDSGKVRVFINGEEITVFRGLQVRHALLALNQELYEAAIEGRVVVRDEMGHVVGLEGALREGARLIVAPHG